MFVTTGGHVKILDFGLATFRAPDVAASAHAETRPGFATEICSLESGRADIWVMNEDGTNRWQVTTDGVAIPFSSRQRRRP